MRKIVLALAAVAAVGIALPVAATSTSTSASAETVVIKRGHRHWDRGHHYGWRNRNRVVVREGYRHRRGHGAAVIVR